MSRLTGKTAIITGASSGIGKETALLLATEGVDLILTGRRKDRLETLKHQIKEETGARVEIHSFDVSRYEECREFVETLEKPADILINNAGLALGTDPVYALEAADLEAMIDTNIKGLLYLTQLISPAMKSRNSGHIINIGSIAGHSAYPGGVVYCATKHAVKAITESTKMDLHGTKVRVSMVSPGLVDTEFSTVRFKGDKAKADAVYRGLEPLTGRDIAEIIVFIAGRPPHVNIMDTIIYPVYQSAATMVYRDDT